MSCSINKTKGLARDKKIIDKFNKLIDTSGEGITKFNEFAANIKNLAIKKFGELPEGIKSAMYIQGDFVIFNELFFDWVDYKNTPEISEFKKEKENTFFKKGSDEQKSEDLRIEQEQKEFSVEDLYEKSLSLTDEQIAERIKQCE